MSRPLPEIFGDLDSAIRRLDASPLSKVEPYRSALAVAQLTREAMRALSLETHEIACAAPRG